LEQVEAWQAETRRTRADALRDAIAEAIVCGELAAGQRLDEVSVAQRFSVSRTPVREALKQLATMDLVILRPHRGAVVAGLDATRSAELFEAMEEVEAVCSRLAATKMSRADRERFDATFMRCDAALLSGGDLELVHETNIAFHTAIHQGAQNSFLAEAAWVLRRKLAPLSRAQFGLTDRPENSAAEHRAIFESIVAREATAAEQAMRIHIRSVACAFDRWLGSTANRPLA
jgi:DNA-binding GntR family transcriptional regulator